MVVFAKSARLPRGRVEQDVPLTDVSADNDWSAVKVWYRDSVGLGAKTYPIFGFVHGRPVTAASAPVRPAPQLIAPHPDQLGALIDAHRRNDNARRSGSHAAHTCQTFLQRLRRDRFARRAGEVDIGQFVIAPAPPLKPQRYEHVFERQKLVMPKLHPVTV